MTVIGRRTLRTTSAPAETQSRRAMRVALPRRRSMGSASSIGLLALVAFAGVLSASPSTAFAAKPCPSGSIVFIEKGKQVCVKPAASAPSAQAALVKVFLPAPLPASLARSLPKPARPRVRSALLTGDKVAATGFTAIAATGKPTVAAARRDTYTDVPLPQVPGFPGSTAKASVTTYRDDDTWFQDGYDGTGTVTFSDILAGAPGGRKLPKIAMTMTYRQPTFNRILRCPTPDGEITGNDSDGSVMTFSFSTRGRPSETGELQVVTETSIVAHVGDDARVTSYDLHYTRVFAEKGVGDAARVDVVANFFKLDPHVPYSAAATFGVLHGLRTTGTLNGKGARLSDALYTTMNSWTAREIGDSVNRWNTRVLRSEKNFNDDADCLKATSTPDPIHIPARGRTSATLAITTKIAGTPVAMPLSSSCQCGISPTATASGADGQASFVVTPPADPADISALWAVDGASKRGRLHRVIIVDVDPGAYSVKLTIHIHGPAPDDPDAGSGWSDDETMTFQGSGPVKPGVDSSFPLTGSSTEVFHQEFINNDCEEVPVTSTFDVNQTIDLQGATVTFGANGIVDVSTLHVQRNFQQTFHSWDDRTCSFDDGVRTVPAYDALYGFHGDFDLDDFDPVTGSLTNSYSDTTDDAPLIDDVTYSITPVSG